MNEREWLNEFPVEWKELRADFLCDPIRQTVCPELFEGQTVAHYSIPQVQETGGPSIEPADDIDSAKLLVTKSTLLVSKLNPRKRTICIAYPQPGLPTLASGEFVPIYSEHFNQRYGYYLWLSEKVTDRLSAIVQSATRSHQRVNPADILKIRWKWPPLSLQMKIAAFLDEKTAQIDALIEKKQQLLERLAEKLQAIITQAVTKGFNPSAPMKDSGIEWLGQIPAHWDVKRLRFLVRLHSGATPTTGANEYWDGYLNWISPKDMKRDSIIEIIDKVTELAVDEYGLTCFSETNVVIVVRGMILAKTVPVAIALGRYTINQDMKALVTNGKMVPEYLQMYLSAIRSFLTTLIAEAGHGTKALRTDVLVDTPTLIPPISEQETIAVQVQQQKGDLDTLSECVSKAVARLTEYRAALITAAVTGQVKELR